MNIPKHYQKIRDVKVTPEDLIAFEDKVKYAYENAQIKGPVHLSKNNEEQLIELFQLFSEPVLESGFLHRDCAL